MATLENWQGYKESADPTKIGPESLTYPSHDVLISKRTVFTRGGMVNDGTPVSGDFPIHSEFVWKDSPGGVRPMRVFGQTLQVKHDGVWITIFTGLDSGVERVFFCSWTDINTTVIKKRLVFCDGSRNLYSWNGFIGTVASYAAPTVTFVADKANLGLMGADAGNVQTRTVTVMSLDTGGFVDASEDRTYNTNPTAGLTITLDAPVGGFTPVAGDIVVSKPDTFAAALPNNRFIDVVFNFKNHVVAACYDTGELLFSHVVTYDLAGGFDFVQPVVGSRTAVTPILLQLDGNFMGMEGKQDLLWVSDADDWYKLTKSTEINAYGLWVDVQKFETGERKGCLPMAVAKHKGDIIYMAQDKTLNRITTLDIIGKDDILLLSDEVEAMFKRLNSTDLRLKYIDRGIYITYPRANTLVILDTAEQTWFFQPPQTLPITCISVIDGDLYGHHNSRNETYELFSGRNDLGAERAQAVIATPLLHDGSSFGYKRHSVFGINCRLNDTAEVLGERFFEENGNKAASTYSFVGADIKTYASDDDDSWATSPYASAGWGGADMVVADLKRAFVFDKERQDGYFDLQVTLTISGEESEFRLLGIYFNETASSRQIDRALFVPR